MHGIFAFGIFVLSNPISTLSYWISHSMHAWVFAFGIFVLSNPISTLSYWITMLFTIFTTSTLYHNCCFLFFQELSAVISRASAIMVQCGSGKNCKQHCDPIGKGANGV